MERQRTRSRDLVVLRLPGRALLWLPAMVVVWWLLAKVWGVVVLAACGFLIAGALMPAVDVVWRATKRRSLSVLLVVVAVLAAIGLVFAVAVPELVVQGRALWERWPEWQQSAVRFAERRGWDQLANQIDAYHPADAVTPFLLDTGRLVLNSFISVVTVLVLAAYFLIDARRLKYMLYFATPRRWHRHIRYLLPELQSVVGGYVRGQAITSAAIAAFSFVFLTVLGVPNPVALAAIAAIADMIPFIGIYVMLLPMVLTAYTVSSTTAIIVAAMIVLYSQFEDRILVPRVYGRTLRLPTITVVLAILAGGELLGVVGALLGLPAAAALRVIIEYVAAGRRATRTPGPRRAGGLTEAMTDPPHAPPLLSTSSSVEATASLPPEHAPTERAAALSSDSATSRNRTGVRTQRPRSARHRRHVLLKRDH